MSHDPKQPKKANDLVVKMRIERSQCPTHGLDLVHIMIVGRRETLCCPDKFCGYSVTRDR